jgi:hypothetical protein
VKALRMIAALGVVGLLAGCGAGSSPEPTPTVITDETRVQLCEEAAAEIVAAVQVLVEGYEPAGAAPERSPEPGTVEPTPSVSDDPLGDAVETARQTRERLGCDDPAFQASLEEGLDAIEPETAIPAAIWRRLSASLLGEVRQDAGEWALEPGADLHDAVARAAEGTTIVLSAGAVELEETLVLLQGVTLRGAGRDATTIRSSAPDAAVIVATAGLVRLEDLTLELAGEQAASGLVAGPSASVSLLMVRVAGAVAAADGVGGAGVYLSAEGDEGSGRGTTLEVTDALFERNQWAGITVAGGHRVSIRSAVFAGNGDVGILFLDSASGSVSASTFTDNGVALAASGSATPTWLSNTISGGSVGMQLDADAVPVIDLVKVSGTGSAAVIFGGRAAGSITGTVCENVPFGIVISDTAAPTVGANSCTLARGGS